ncbi:EAL domain-containing protein [Alteromonas sp. AMM-1]|uniref:EAL domain-containing protein n=1 Tax=Alteromonas sp. AMM-1 TaxID=3394233 RepID=UPI0039A45D43
MYSGQHEQSYQPLTVLVVDDEKAIVNALKRELRSLDCDVITATSGRKAMSILQSQPVTLMITDHNMPEVSGVDLLRFAHQYSPQTKSYMLSGEGDLQAAVELLNQGLISKYLSKPWDKRALQEEVSGILNACRAADNGVVHKELKPRSNSNVIRLQDYNALILIRLLNSSDILLSYGEQQVEALEVLLAGRIDGLVTQSHKLRLEQSGVFGLYLEQATVEQTQILCAQIRQQLQRTFNVNGAAIFCHIGIGFRALHDNKLDHGILINSLADTIVRDSHRISVSHLDNSTISQYQRQQLLSAEVEQGLKNQEFKLAFQPKVSTSTGLIQSAEILLRWQHHSLGWVPPSEFICLTELDGQIKAIGEWVLDNGFKAASELRRFSTELTSIAINISAKQLQSSHIVEFISEKLKQYYLPPSFIELEITETALAENGQYLEEILWQLKLLGLKLSIDDFGAGFTSFSYLSKLPIDILKLDRSLIMGLHKDRQRQEFIGSLIVSCKKLGIKVVAEGVEEQEELACLKSMRCDTIQGFIYSPAVPRQEFEKLMIRQPFVNKH